MLHNDTILIQTFADQDIKKYGFLSISLDNDGYFIHEGSVFFSDIAAPRAMILAQGKEWTGEDCIDDYC